MKTDYNNNITLKKQPDILVVIPFIYEIGLVYVLINISCNIVFRNNLRYFLNISIESLPNLLYFLLFTLPFFIFLFVCIDVQCWNFNGKEIVSFSDDYLCVSQKGRILKYNRRINYKDIVYIEFEKYPRGPLGIDVFYTHGWKGGCVKITKKNGDSYYFGQSLTAPEAKRQIIPKVKENIFEKSGIQF